MERKNGSQDVSKQAKRIEVDVAKYDGMIDDPSLSDADRAAIIEALWSIICISVDLGFEVHPVQEAQKASPGVGDALNCKNIKEKQQCKKEAALNEPRPGE